MSSTRTINIKIDFSGTTYSSSSLFNILADGGLYHALDVPYSQLTSTGPGYDLEVGPYTDDISITANKFGTACFNTTVTSSINPWPTPTTSPMLFPSTAENMRNILRTYGITQVTGSVCNDIYVLGAGNNNVRRLHNITGEEYDNKGPFDYLTSSYNQPDQGDILYIPEYDAIAYGKDSTSTEAGCCIISMSGDILFEADPTEPSGSVRGLGRFEAVQDDYLYVYGSIYTTAHGLIDCYRIHLPTMTMDYDWLADVASNFMYPFTQIIPPTGSSDIYIAHDDVLHRYDNSGNLLYQLQVRDAGAAGDIASFVQNANGDLIIGGRFNELRYYSGSAPLNIVGRTPEATMLQYGIAKLDNTIDFRPYSASFSRYTVNPFNNPVDFSTDWYGPFRLALDSNENIIGGFKGTDPVNSNISGSYANVSGSLAIFDPTGSMIPNWNYPQNVDLNNAQVKYVEARRLYVQEDDSLVVLLDKYSPTQPLLNLLNYDNKVVGTQMIVSQSGVVTDY